MKINSKIMLSVEAVLLLGLLLCCLFCSCDKTPVVLDPSDSVDSVATSEPDYDLQTICPKCGVELRDSEENYRVLNSEYKYDEEGYYIGTLVTFRCLECGCQFTQLML